MNYYICDYYDSELSKYKTIEVYANTFIGALRKFRNRVGVAVHLRRTHFSGRTQEFKHGANGFAVAITQA